MPFHSQRNVAISAGDAAVLVRALNRQRADASAKAQRTAAVDRSVPDEAAVRMKDRGAFVSKGRAADLDDRVLPFVRRTPSGQGRPTVPGSGAFPPVRDELPRREGSAATGGDVLSSDRRESGPAIRVVRRERDATDHRRAPQSRVRDDDREAHSNRAARTAGSHRRSSDADRTPRGSNPLAVVAWFSDLAPRTRKVLAVATCVVALVAFFYGPTADLYAASRDHAQLVAKVEATNAIADDLKAEVDRLQTEEGVMDEARIRGYANPGEVAGDASELLGIEDTVTVPELSKPIATEEPPLYIRALDVIMGYEEHV